MSSTAVIAIAIAAVVVLAAVVLLTAARRSDVRGAGALSRETRRRDRDAEIDRPHAATGRDVERAAVERRTAADVEPVAPAAPTLWIPPDPEALGVSRRQFFNRATVSLMSVGLGTFAAAGFVAFLWPTGSSGFGGKGPVGKLDEIKEGIRGAGGFFYVAEARTWITAYPADALPKAKAVYDPLILAGMEQGIVALYQKCPHLGCRVPQCLSSQWFECPCHGSQYNQVGEKKAGPAPRGMDRWPITITATGDVTVDTSGNAILGPVIGTNTTGQEAEGPHCITGGH
jgi:cytochrome b6-f complex iron-sulfur subunit